jgi:hypothetical protein
LNNRAVADKVAVNIDETSTASGGGRHVMDGEMREVSYALGSRIDAIVGAGAAVPVGGEVVLELAGRGLAGCFVRGKESDEGFGPVGAGSKSWRGGGVGHGGGEEDEEGEEEGLKREVFHVGRFEGSAEASLGVCQGKVLWSYWSW